MMKQLFVAWRSNTNRLFQRPESISKLWTDSHFVKGIGFSNIPVAMGFHQCSDLPLQCTPLTVVPPALRECPTIPTTIEQLKPTMSTNL